jgi:hypothetical protein
MKFKEFSQLIKSLYPNFDFLKIRYSYRVFKQTEKKIAKDKDCSFFETVIDKYPQEYISSKNVDEEATLIPIELAVIDSEFYGKF